MKIWCKRFGWMVNFGTGKGSDDGKQLFGRAVLHRCAMEFSAAYLLTPSSGQQPSEDRPPTAGLTRLVRELIPRRAAGPGPARVLVHPSETWSHPRGTLGRCLKGSEINIQCFKYYIVMGKLNGEMRSLPIRHSS